MRNRLISSSMVIFSMVLIFFSLPAKAATALADEPIPAANKVPGNLLLALSVEYPTGNNVAHLGTYTNTNTYLGYFDSNKCYAYKSVTNETNTDKSHFYPIGVANNRTCAGQWSGNFMNWASMQTIDAFRWALAGGFRTVDLPRLTILERAWADGKGGTAIFPDRQASTSGNMPILQPIDNQLTTIQVQGRGNSIRFLLGGNSYDFFVRVKVCDPAPTAGGIESNCKTYPSGNLKPEGLMHQYQGKIKFSAIGYLNDDNIFRDGGVLRAKQKYIGPTMPTVGGPNIANPAAEWDARTGVFTQNPDAIDAQNATRNFGVPIVDSGIINYLNKFGQKSKSYKTFDPVGELYYAAIRYYKNLGNIPAWSSTQNANLVQIEKWLDGFPVITEWDDPIQYSCQKNFILGIGDVFTHSDKNVPGSRSSNIEPVKPPEVLSDISSDVIKSTNQVGNLQGIPNLASLENYQGCCSNNSAFIAGMAYEANTMDIRPDVIARLNTIGKQTVQTFWLDTLEYQLFKPDNIYYLATKYGGFDVPENFDPYGPLTTLPTEWWSKSNEIVGTGSGNQIRPDNYFTGGRPDQIIDGLKRAFLSIISKIKSFSTAFSTPSPVISGTETSNFSASYNSQNWTGDVIASALQFVENADPILTQKWQFSEKLRVQLAGNGWSDQRRVITWNPTSNAGVPFRIGSINAAQTNALNTSYRTGNDSSDYLNYLRGDQTQEQGSTNANSSRAYRSRTQLIGDIFGSKTKIMPPPNLLYSDTNNPGYSAFKSSWANRPTTVFVGANDGMLHAIDGRLTGDTAGNELFAYIPSSLFNGPNNNPDTDGLAALGNPFYEHRNYVDATPVVMDIDFSKTLGSTSNAPNWRSILIGGLGKGGKQYYALDVTDPANMANSEATAASKVLWEFSDPDMGYSYGEPIIVKTKQLGWVVIFTSGYNNTDGIGYFFIVNPRTGALIQKIATGTVSRGQDAGLAQANAFVNDRSNFTADAVYAGDLLGNLWRLDLTPATGNYAAPTKIAVLTDAQGNAQPITTKPLIEINPSTGNRYVLIGTGRLLDISDISDSQEQSFYAINDGNGARFNSAQMLPSNVSFPINRSHLANNTNPLAQTTINPNTQIGWYLNLGSSSNIGWRVTTKPSTYNGGVAFSADLPSNEPCGGSGINRVYYLDFVNGQSRLGTTNNPQAFLLLDGGQAVDLVFSSVNGKVGLGIGQGSGSLNIQPTPPPPPTVIRRLNWRELPIVN